MGFGSRFNGFLRSEFKRAARYRAKSDPIQRQWREIEKLFEFVNESKREYEKSKAREDLN